MHNHSWQMHQQGIKPNVRVEIGEDGMGALILTNRHGDETRHAMLNSQLLALSHGIQQCTVNWLRANLRTSAHPKEDRR